MKRILLFFFLFFPFLIHGFFTVCDEPGLQLYPTIGFDGTNYLFIWSDIRYPPEPQLYASRVTQSGIVLDTTGIHLLCEYDEQKYASTAFDGTNHLVVYQYGC
jgi:hypothetical protein